MSTNNEDGYRHRAFPPCDVPTHCTHKHVICSAFYRRRLFRGGSTVYQAAGTRRCMQVSSKLPRDFGGGGEVSWKRSGQPEVTAAAAAANGFVCFYMCAPMFDRIRTQYNLCDADKMLALQSCLKQTNGDLQWSENNN